MVEEAKQTDTNTKTQLSLAAALFFAPLVSYILDRTIRDISQQDKEFIRGYIKFGYITLALWTITLVAGIMNYLFVAPRLDALYSLCIIFLLGLLVLSMICILTDISLLKGSDYHISIYSVEGNKKDLILKYLPIYNIYLWYTAHSFEKPNRWIKESLLVWLICIAVCMTGSIWATTMVSILIIIRVASLVSDIDIVATKTKQWLNTLFTKNPEELWGYVTWCIRYVATLFPTLWTRKATPLNLSAVIEQEKQAYSRIIDIDTPLIWEYSIWLVGCISIAYFLSIDMTIWTYTLGFGLLLARYILMALQWKHLPHLPLAREVVLLCQRIWTRFKPIRFIKTNQPDATQ